MVTVPTLADLAHDGLATVIERNAKGEPTILRPTPEGQRVIYAAMHTNAERAKIRTMRALDPEGSADMTQQHNELRPEITVPQCRAVNQHAIRCTQVEGHERVPGSKHDADVSFETRAAIHARVIGVKSW